MAGITTHVLDIARGRPAAGVPVTLEFRRGDGSWSVVGRGETDADGRLRDLTGEEIGAGTYRITFDTRVYFERTGVEGFFPEAAVLFEVRNAAEHHHVPLLLSPFGYSTYRGS